MVYLEKEGAPGILRWGSICFSGQEKADEAERKSGNIKGAEGKQARALKNGSSGICVLGTQRVDTACLQPV
jgi:hypothetical protein